VKEEGEVHLGMDNAGGTCFCGLVPLLRREEREGFWVWLLSEKG
jgi:hypothetical protein